MNIAIASYAFHGLHAAGIMDVFGYLETCKYRYHLRSADIWNGMLPTTDQDFIQKVKIALDERGLELANLCVDGAHIWEDDLTVREKNYKNAWAHLRAAKSLDARTVRIDAGVRDDTFSDEQFDWIVKRYKEYAQFASDNGFKVGPENHWGAEVVPANMIRLCEAVDHPAFGVLLHFRGNEGDAVMAPWAMHTHITGEIAHTCLQDRIVLLKPYHYQGFWSIEHQSGKDEYINVAIQLELLKQVLSTEQNL